jgi:hypothetical protein
VRTTQILLGAGLPGNRTNLKGEWLNQPT